MSELEPRIKAIYEILTERYKDEPYLRIYTGKKANQLETILTGEGIMDEEHISNTLFACTDLQKIINGDNKIGLEGGYFLYFREDGNLTASWSCHPVDKYPNTFLEVIAELDRFKDEWKDY